MIAAIAFASSEAHACNLKLHAVIDPFLEGGAHKGSEAPEDNKFLEDMTLGSENDLLLDSHTGSTKSLSSYNSDDTTKQGTTEKDKIHRVSSCTSSLPNARQCLTPSPTLLYLQRYLDWCHLLLEGFWNSGYDVQQLNWKLLHGFVGVLFGCRSI